jgi:flagellar basal-body rod protein FlgB
MLPNLFTSTTIPALGEVLNFAQARHGVLVGNLANINTPGYKVRDLSVDTFQQKLKDAISQSQAQSRSQSQPLSPGITQAEPGDPMRKVRETLTNVLYHDDTNIDLEKQTAEITKNQFLHNFALTVMTDQMSLLQNAISERV